MIDFKRLLQPQLPFPPRCRWFPVPILGAGTAELESLRSLFFRVAKAHGNKPSQLICDIVPSLRRPGDADKLVSSWYSHKKALSESLNQATMLTDLERLTMLPWQNVVVAEGLYFPNMRWCPECLRQDRPGESYERLLWNIACVRACPTHRALLREVCSKCGSKPARDTTQSVQRSCHCAACSGSLTVPVEARPEERDLYISQSMGELLVKGWSGFIAAPDRIKDVWQKIVFPCFDSKVQAAATLGLTQHFVYQSCNYTTKMKLSHWAQLSWGLGVPLTDLLLAPAENICPKPQQCEPFEGKRRTTKKDLRVKAFAVAKKKKGKSVTVRKLAMEMEVGTTRIRRQLPAIAKSLTLKRRQEIARKREAKLQLLIGAILRSQDEGTRLSTRQAMRLTKVSTGFAFEKLMDEASARIRGERFPFEGLNPSK